MTESLWTPALVEERLEEAADVLRRLPEQRVRGYFSLWPPIAYEFGDLVGQEPPIGRPAVPAPDAITRMERTLDWLRWLDPEDAKLVWARAEGVPWKAIGWHFGLPTRTACGFRRRRPCIPN